MTPHRGRPVKIVLSCEERERLTAFFSLLIKIDRRISEEKRKTKRPKIRDIKKGSLKMRALFLFMGSLSLEVRI